MDIFRNYTLSVPYSPKRISRQRGGEVLEKSPPWGVMNSLWIYAITIKTLIC